MVSKLKQMSLMWAAMLCKPEKKKKIIYIALIFQTCTVLSKRIGMARPILLVVFSLYTDIWGSKDKYDMTDVKKKKT